MSDSKPVLPGWARVLAVLVGLVSIVAAVVVLAFPGIALLTLEFLLGIALLFIGVDRLMSGITGHPYQGLFGMAPPGSPPPSSPPGPT